MVTQTIHVGDCELLEHYMDVTDAANPKWQNWDNREWLEGLNARRRRCAEPVHAAPARQQRVRQRLARPHAAGDEPAVRSAGAGTERMDPAEMAASTGRTGRTCENVYGVGADGYARRPGTTSACSTA